MSWANPTIPTTPTQHQAVLQHWHTVALGVSKRPQGPTACWLRVHTQATQTRGVSCSQPVATTVAAMEPVGTNTQQGGWSGLPLPLR